MMIKKHEMPWFSTDRSIRHGWLLLIPTIVCVCVCVCVCCVVCVHTLAGCAGVHVYAGVRMCVFVLHASVHACTCVYYISLYFGITEWRVCFTELKSVY